MLQETFIQALKESSKEKPIIFSAGQELDLTLPGNLHLLLRSVSGTGVKMYREKHEDRLSSSIVVESGEIFLDIEQRKGIQLQESNWLAFSKITEWVNTNVLKEHLFAIVGPLNHGHSSAWKVLYWG